MIMNFIKNIALCGVVCCLTASCGDDFLDKMPSENASEDQINDILGTEPEAIQAYITGYYANLFKPESQDAHDDFGLKAIELANDMMGSDIAYYTSHFFVYDYNWDNRGATFRRTTQTWQQLYAVISGANQVIGNLKNTLEGAEGKNKMTIENMLGQSYVVRAYCYFWLVNMYQHPYSQGKDAPGVPIYTEDETLLSRQPVSAVYKRILADLDLGYTLLKGKEVTTNKTELSEFAAAAIYANVLSFVNDHPNQWEEVAKWANLAIVGGVLMDSEALLSGFNNVNLSEVLWGADIDDKTNTYYASFMSHIDPFSNGYGGALQNYKMIASDLYDKIPDADIRKQWFGIDIEEKNSHYKFKQYIQKKFVDVGLFQSDYIYLRTGEMYFVAAEALYLVGKERDAKAKLLEIMKTRNPDYSVSFSGAALLEEIKLQKRIEMWGEGRRFLDMKRRSEPLDRTKGINHGAVTIKTAAANDYRMIYMIPQKEVDANSELTDLNP